MTGQTNEDYKNPKYHQVLPYKIYKKEEQYFENNSILILCSNDNPLFNPPYYYLIGTPNTNKLEEMSEQEKAFLEVYFGSSLSANYDSFVRVTNGTIIGKPMQLKDVDKEWFG